MNLRPPRPERGALTGLRHSPKDFLDEYNSGRVTRQPKRMHPSSVVPAGHEDSGSLDEERGRYDG